MWIGETWCLDPSKIEGAITERTKGIIAVHLYGHPADMDQINKIAAVHGLWVVEDAAEAPLATYKGRPTGGLAKIGTFSFYGNKVITSGEGGAVTVSDPDPKRDCVQFVVRAWTQTAGTIFPSRAITFDLRMLPAQYYAHSWRGARS